MLKTSKKLWKIIAICGICFSTVMTGMFSYIFVREGYPSRLARKFGIQGYLSLGRYSPTDREMYIIRGWSNSLNDFNADIVFAGDSITSNGNWSEYFPEIAVCNLGVAGDSVEELNYRINMVEKLNPQKIFLMIGVNNISRHKYRQTIEE